MTTQKERAAHILELGERQLTNDELLSIDIIDRAQDVVEENLPDEDLTNPVAIVDLFNELVKDSISLRDTGAITTDDGIWDYLRDVEPSVWCRFIESTADSDIMQSLRDDTFPASLAWALDDWMLNEYHDEIGAVVAWSIVNENQWVADNEDGEAA